MINLIVNAIQAMALIEDRPRELVIRTRLHETSQTLMAVQDSGPGIDAKTEERLFKAFFTTNRDGMGMGLSKPMAGRYGVSRNTGAGATFQFALPPYRKELS
jgi:C4-dicarboxylate-specific signal transduction histidine kinase